MTFANMVAFVKRLSRTSSNALTITDTDDVTRTYLNLGVREFCKKVHGIPKREYVTISPKWDIQTNFAIEVEITGGVNAMGATDVVIAESEQFSLTGAAVASHIQTMLNAVNVVQGASGSVVVTWDASNFCFYLDAQATSIAISAPNKDTYADYTAELFGKTGTQATTTWLSGFPEDCTVEADVPSDFLEDKYVEWDKSQLSRAPFDVFLSPQCYGEPTYYSIKADKMRFYPTPNVQKKCFMHYRSIPASLTITGSSDSTECSLPENYHMAPVYYAAGLVAEERFEASISNRMMGRFIDMVTDYMIREANQNPSLSTPAEGPVIPKVIM